MPGGGYTGDGSVKWFVDSAEPRVTELELRPGAHGKGLYLEGVDESPAGAEFTISIEIPLNVPDRRDARSKFFEKLHEVLKVAESAPPERRTKLTFTLPIQDKTSGAYNPDPEHYQVEIRWPARDSSQR
jgi:hypothetical protein